MNPISIKLIVLFTTLALEFSSPTSCKANPNKKDADEAEKVSISVGRDKAITRADRNLGIQLSKSAIQLLNLTFAAIQDSDTQQLSKEGLVRFKDEVGIYRLRDGWFKFVKIQILSQTNAEFKVKTTDLRARDQVVIKGVPLVRVAELEALGSSEED